jgi:hypothetical protein
MLTGNCNLPKYSSESKLSSSVTECILKLWLVQCSAGTFLKENTGPNLYTYLQGKKTTFNATIECGQVRWTLQHGCTKQRFSFSISSLTMIFGCSAPLPQPAPQGICSARLVLFSRTGTSVSLAPVVFSASR